MDEVMTIAIMLECSASQANFPLNSTSYRTNQTNKQSEFVVKAWTGLPGVSPLCNVVAPKCKLRQMPGD
jgi:hypothetical protein